MPAFIGRYEDELIADFRHEYGVGLYEVSPFEAMALIRQLPANSRTALKQSPDLKWPPIEQYVASIEYSWRQWLWANSSPKKRGPEPKPWVPKAYREERVRKGSIKDIEPLPIEELEKKLRAPRVPIN